MLRDQRILVTGATGQVARVLAETLNERNEVVAAARFTNAEAKKALEAQGIGTAYLSIGDEDLSTLPDVDYVFHCGANTYPRTTDEALLHNAEGVGFLMKRYRHAKGFLHMSSSSVYRVSAGMREPVREDHDLGGHSAYSPPYAMSKLAGEAVVRFQARALSLPTIITRLDVAYGSQGHGGAPMILYEMMKGGQAYTRAESGETYCSLIHEDDIAEQCENLIERADVPAVVVNLGGDQPTPMGELIAYIESLTGLEMKIETGPEDTWGMKVLDNTLRKELGGPCKVSWKDGVRRALEARYPGAVES